MHNIRRITKEVKEVFVDVNDLIICLHKDMAKATCEAEVKTYKKVLQLLTDLKGGSHSLKKN